MQHVLEIESISIASLLCSASAIAIIFISVSIFKTKRLSSCSFCSLQHRRTRAVFDVAVQVHQNIQQRDIEVGRSLGNWILRWLDQIKPSAQISVPPMGKPFSNTSNMTKHLTYSSLQKTPGRFQRFSPRNIWPKPFPTIATIMRPGTSIQYKRLSHRRGAFEGVIRKDIMQWMLQN